MTKTDFSTASIFFSCILFLLSCSTDHKEYYVSPSGNDQNKGDKSQPYATLERAKEAVAEIMANKNIKIVSIILEPGRYGISKPIVFSSEEFTNADHKKLLVKNTSQEEVVISGGTVLGQWEKSENGIWVADLPESLPEDAQVRELFIDGKRAQRARYPNEGYLRVDKVGADKRTHFFFKRQDFPHPQKVSTTELVLLHDWSISRLPILAIDQENLKLTSIDSIGASLDFFTLDHWETHPRYYLENDRAFLDEDYEWYFDRESLKIFVKLPASEVIENHQFIIPISNNLIHLEGTSEKPLLNITFEGITFRHSAWDIPPNGYAGVQAAHYDTRAKSDNGWSVVPGAIMAEFIDSCVFRDCVFENLGGSGLWLGAGTTNNQVIGCLFRDISANGIMIGEGQDRKINGAPWWQTAPEQVAKNNLIEACEIFDCGKQYYGAVGIWCGLTEGTKINDNAVYDLPYTGISIGWMWNPTPTPAKQNLVSGNHIHHIMQKLSDGGGIYMLGLQPGSKLSNNIIHDVTVNVGRAESNGMFLDEGITDVVVAENTIYNIAKSPIRFHKATTNIVQHNTLFCGEGVPAFTYNNTDSTLIQKIGNTVYHPTDLNYQTALEEVQQMQK